MAGVMGSISTWLVATGLKKNRLGKRADISSDLDMAFMLSMLAHPVYIFKFFQNLRKIKGGL